MSLTRRLTRILRAHLGDMRTDDPLDDIEVEPLSDDGPSASTHDTTSDSTSAADGTADVPPDVAKAYRALEVPVGSDRETVKKGYRRMMKKYHQDRFTDDDEKREIAGTVSKRINRAHDRILEYLDEAD